MKFAAFDLEIAKDIPESGRWQDVAPLGITCAAVAFSDNKEPVFWQGIPKMTQVECQNIANILLWIDISLCWCTLRMRYIIT